MKKNIFTKFIFTIVTALTTLLISINVFGAECSYSTGTIISSTSECHTQPDIQRVTFYKAALCSSEPTAPTDAAHGSTVYSINSCRTVWENTAGEAVDIIKGTTVNLPGEASIPNDGTYNYLFLELGLSFGVKTTEEFSANRTGTYTGAGVNTGRYCWTLSKSHYNNRTTNDDASRCGTSPGTADLTYTVFNDFDGAGDATYSATTSATSKPLKAYLVNSSGSLITPVTDNASSASKLIAWIGNQNISITSKTKGFTVYFYNSLGTSINQVAGTVRSFGAGAFDMYITTTESQESF